MAAAPSRRDASYPCHAVRRLSEAPRRVREGVNESFGRIVPAVPASILFFARNHALTRVAPQKLLVLIVSAQQVAGLAPWPVF